MSTNKTEQWFMCYGGKDPNMHQAIGERKFSFLEAFIAGVLPSIAIIAGLCGLFYVFCGPLIKEKVKTKKGKQKHSGDACEHGEDTSFCADN